MESIVGAEARITHRSAVPDNGSFYPATVLRDVRDTAALFTEEVFGPVASIAPWRTDDEVVAHANDPEFYFVVVGEDVERPEETVMLARNDFGSSNPDLPYRLADSAAVRWLMKQETVEMLAAQISALELVGIRAQVRLGSGEIESSQVVPF